MPYLKSIMEIGKVSITAITEAIPKVPNGLFSIMEIGKLSIAAITEVIPKVHNGLNFLNGNREIVDSPIV
jgi:hypothetical protein